MPFQPGGYGFEQSQGKCPFHGIPASLQGHVHDSDGAAAALEIAVGEGNVFQPAGAYVVQALEGGGSGTEEYRAALDPAQHQGGVPAVIAESLVGLFVGLVVLFVHYDEAQAAVGQEKGGAEAQDDVRFCVGGHPAVDLPPVRSCLLGVVYQ